MTKLPMYKVFLPLYTHIESVSVQLTKGDNQLERVSMTTSGQVSNGRREAERTIYHGGDGFHADREWVGPVTMSKDRQKLIITTGIKETTTKRMLGHTTGWIKTCTSINFEINAMRMILIICIRVMWLWINESVGGFSFLHIFSL